MKKIFVLLISTASIALAYSQSTTIRISTDETDLILKVAPGGQLCQSYLGEKLNTATDLDRLPANYIEKYGKRKWEVYPASGGQDSFEPAFAIRHNDGNLTSVFRYVSHEVKKVDDNVTLTTILLRDDVYPVEVQLFYQTFAKENIIKARTEIRHREKKPVTISRYASSMLYFEAGKYFLTQFNGNWSGEAQIHTQELLFGKKVIDSKLGTRAAIQAQPFFRLGFDRPASEQAQVLMGTIGWTGNFQFTFEVDNLGALRIVSGINPYASNYELKPDEVFVTPEFIFTLSRGTGAATRNFHAWARNYQLKDGTGDRLTLLNNWEATFFDFDEKKLEELIPDARYLGVDMFLLDAGWCGNKYPHVNESQGLGDWETMHNRLPRGIPHLVKTARDNGLQFGLWIEPEMVHPRSELFEKHPGWAMTIPNRETYYERNQLVLDMVNPEVQQFVFGIIDRLMQENPELAYLKWDCNSPMTNIYSNYLKDRQNNLYIDYVRALYQVLDRIKEKYPRLQMMLCASGGGRCDFEALKYFTELWTSDNTNPVDRLYIQWGFSQIMPVKALAAHVTAQNTQASIKFRADVAMMCKFGFDIDLNHLTENERIFCRQAVLNYNQIKKTVLDGDMYHLVSPYEGNHLSVMYVDEAKEKAVLFAYDIFPVRNETILPVKLQGLDPGSQYKVEEINRLPDEKPDFESHGKIFSGDYLMKLGFPVFTARHMNSKIIVIHKQ
ncbi:MAG: alpha-galactosidase [Dysgonamonadaceae bacterium]|jgi:alpha-galactosidase|nr:alpha-galactosidase [Dysgonamonadaceae bacterium]